MPAGHKLLLNIFVLGLLSKFTSVMKHWFFNRLGLKGFEKICEVRKYINVTYVNTVSLAETSVSYVVFLTLLQAWKLLQILATLAFSVKWCRIWYSMLLFCTSAKFFMKWPAIFLRCNWIYCVRYIIPTWCIYGSPVFPASDGRMKIRLILKLKLFWWYYF